MPLADEIIATLDRDHLYAIKHALRRRIKWLIDLSERPLINDELGETLEAALAVDDVLNAYCPEYNVTAARDCL